MTRQEFIKAWIQHFAPYLNRKQYKLLKDGYIWHLFSYEMIPKENFLVGEEACKAYDRIDKTGAIASFEEYLDKRGTESLEKEFFLSKDVVDYPELYIVGKDWSWTFISTHENFFENLGPYFMKLK